MIEFLFKNYTFEDSPETKTIAAMLNMSISDLNTQMSNLVPDPWNYEWEYEFCDEGDEIIMKAKLIGPKK